MSDRDCMHCHRPLVSRMAWGLREEIDPEVEPYAEPDGPDLGGFHVVTTCGCGEVRESPFFETEQDARFEWSYQMGQTL